MRNPKPSYSPPIPCVGLPRLFLFCLVCAANSACAPIVYDRVELRLAAFSDLPGWHDGSQGNALAAFLKSCEALNNKPGKLAWHSPCRVGSRVAAKDDTAARAFFERFFAPHRVVASDGGGSSSDQGTFTGYYEPELRGARSKGGRYTVPLYMRPPELVSADLGSFRAELKGQRIVGKAVAGTLLPFPARGEIDNGALGGRKLEIVWVDDAVDAFFLHIQGSGRIRLGDGSLLRVGYAATNGRPYSSIGRTLLARGAITTDQMSMQSIRTWLAANPGEAAGIMAANRRYVFFREISGPGPLGAQGVALTPGHSLAVDRKFMPLGAPVWLDTTEPLKPEKPLRRLMVAQDTGSAIRGPVRGDFFWGHGPDAALSAGHMKSRGRYYLLLPKNTKPGT